MPLTHIGLGRRAVRHGDPNSLEHSEDSSWLREKRNADIVDQVVVGLSRQKAAELNVLSDEFHKFWDGWNGDTFLVIEKVVMTGAKPKLELKKCGGNEFTAAVDKVRNLDWYHDLRTLRGKKTLVRRQISPKRKGKLADRHTVSLNPAQMRLLQKLDLTQSQAAEVMQSLLARNIKAFQEKTGGRCVIGGAVHSSGLLHFDIFSSRYGLDHWRHGDKVLHKLPCQDWTVGAFRKNHLGIAIGAEKEQWLSDNLASMGNKTPVLLDLHKQLDKDFADLLGNKFPEEWRESVKEYREWSQRTDSVKDRWALAKVKGRDVIKWVGDIVIHILQIILKGNPLLEFIQSQLTPETLAYDFLGREKGTTLQLCVADYEKQRQKTDTITLGTIRTALGVPPQYKSVELAETKLPPKRKQIKFKDVGDELVL